MLGAADLKTPVQTRITKEYQRYAHILFITTLVYTLRKQHLYQKKYLWSSYGSYKWSNLNICGGESLCNVPNHTCFVVCIKLYVTSTLPLFYVIELWDSCSYIRVLVSPLHAASRRLGNPYCKYDYLYNMHTTLAWNAYIYVCSVLPRYGLFTYFTSTLAQKVCRNSNCTLNSWLAYTLKNLHIFF